MPPRLPSAKRCLLGSELPVLPFLVPRLFQPWPTRFGRGHSAIACQEPNDDCASGSISLAQELQERATKDGLHKERRRKTDGEEYSEARGHPSHRQDPAEALLGSRHDGEESKVTSDSDGRMRGAKEKCQTKELTTGRVSTEETATLKQDLRRTSIGIRHEQDELSVTSGSRGIIRRVIHQPGETMVGLASTGETALPSTSRNSRSLPLRPAGSWIHSQHWREPLVDKNVQERSSDCIPRTNDNRDLRLPWRRPFKRGRITPFISDSMEFKSPDLEDFELDEWIETVKNVPDPSPGYWSLTLRNAILCDKPARGQSQGKPRYWNVSQKVELFSPDIKLWLISQKDSETLREAWSSIPTAVREKLWPELMIMTLLFYPTAALNVLLATYENPLPNPKHVSDSINWIMMYYFAQPPPAGPESLDLWRELAGTVMQLMIKSSQVIRLHDNVVHKMIKAIPQECLQELYKTLHRLGHPLSENSLLSLGFRLATSGNTSGAFRALKELHILGSDFNSPVVLSLCTCILRSGHRSKHRELSNSEIYEFMLQCGIKPNVVILTSLLQNAIDAQDQGTSARIYDMMTSNNIPPGAHAYSYLLRDARLRKDTPTLQRLTGDIRKYGIRNELLATELLISTQILHHLTKMADWDDKEDNQDDVKHREAVFRSMMSMYTEYFTLEPLNRILAPSLASTTSKAGADQVRQAQPTVKSGNSLMEPPPLALFVMIEAFVRACATSLSVRRFYDAFRKMVLAGDPVVKQLVRVPHVYNVVIQSLGRFRETVTDCPRVIGDMLSREAHASSDLIPGTSTYNVEEQVRSRFWHARNGNYEPHMPPQPDVYTWTILLKVFMDHGQARAGEKVVEMMPLRGVTPNLVTWRSLIAGNMFNSRPTEAAAATYRGQIAGFRTHLQPFAEWVSRNREGMNVLSSLWENEQPEIEGLVKSVDEVVSSTKENAEIGNLHILTSKAQRNLEKSLMGKSQSSTSEKPLAYQQKTKVFHNFEPLMFSKKRLSEHGHSAHSAVVVRSEEMAKQRSDSSLVPAQQRNA